MSDFDFLRRSRRSLLLACMALAASRQGPPT